MSQWYIYSLTDPRDGRIRYVGKTDNLKRRLRHHIHDALHRGEKNHRSNWLYNLVSTGQLPTMSVLESGDGDWVVAEKKWIATFRAAGLDLVNATDGGEGMEGASEETRAKLRAIMTGRVVTSEWRARISATRKAMLPPEEKAKWADRLNTPEAKAKNLLSHRRPEVIAKTVAAHLGVKRSAEARANMRDAHRNISAEKKAEMRAKMSAVHKGVLLTAEHRAKIGVASKAAWARRKAVECSP